MRRCNLAARCMLICLFFLCGVVPRAFSQAAAPNAGAAVFREGQAALSRNDLAGAETAFEQAVRLSPHSEPAFAALGGVLLQQGKAADAVHELEIARSLSRSDLNVMLNLALAYQQLGQESKAVPLFAEVISGARLGKQPVPPFVRAAYARALAATGKLPEAAAEMQMAVKSDPQNPALLGDLGSLFAQQKHWPEAQTAFAQVVALDPKSAMAHLRLALAMQAQNQPGALQEFAEAGAIAPNEVPIQLEWGKAVAASGDDAQAIPIFEHVLELQPDSPEATDQLAEAYQRTKRVSEAIELYKKVLKTDLNNATILTNLGMAYAQLQRAKDAVPFLQRAVSLDPQNVTAHQDLAAAYVQLSQFSDAATELRAALKLAPDSPQLHYNLGLALKSEDDAAGAIPELERAEKLDANAPEAPYLLGVLYMQAGRYAEASRELRTSLRLQPENGDGWATLGSVYNKLDQLPEAANALREAIKQLPQQPDPHLTLAAVLMKQNQSAEAAAERKQAATLMRSNMNRQRAEVATNSGKALLKSGDVAGATQQFQDALSYDAQFAEAHLGLASIYDTQGKTAEAATERKKAAEDATASQ